TVLVICARMSIDCSATTLPLARRRTGTSRWTACAVVTATGADFLSPESMGFPRASHHHAPPPASTEKAIVATSARRRVIRLPSRCALRCVRPSGGRSGSRGCAFELAQLFAGDFRCEGQVLAVALD